MKVKTLAGYMQYSNLVHVQDLICLNLIKIRDQLSRNLSYLMQINNMRSFYPGANSLMKPGIDINYSTGTMHWFENVCPMRDPWKLSNKEYYDMACAYDIQTNY